MRRVEKRRQSAKNDVFSTFYCLAVKRFRWNESENSQKLRLTIAD